MSIPTLRLPKPVSYLRKALPVAALALGIGLVTPAFAQHGGGGGGGSHGGGGGGGASHGGGGGGFHGGGGYNGGGGWHGGGWGHGGWGYGGWGWGGGFYPGFGYAYGGYDPFWAYGGYYGPGPYDYPPAYGPGPEAYDPSNAQPEGPQAGGQQPYGPQSYGPSAQYSAPVPTGATGMPTDNSRGFYTWRLGIEGGTCNRPYLQQIAVSLTGAQPASLQSGVRLGGISVQPIIGGKIGPRLDVTDQACATEALEHARTGMPVRWETASGIPVSLRVTKTADGQNGQSCRDYEATAQFASHPDTIRHTACKGTDGSWRVTR